jgi:DNA-binding PadR family transcriptional regulator
LVKRLEERMPGGGKILPGALYRALNRMAEEGLIEESDWRPDPALDDQRRRYFRITEHGRQVAGAEAERMESLVDESRAKKLLASRGR